MQLFNTLYMRTRQKLANKFVLVTQINYKLTLYISLISRHVHLHHRTEYLQLLLSEVKER